MAISLAVIFEKINLGKSSTAGIDFKPQPVCPVTATWAISAPNFSCNKKNETWFSPQDLKQFQEVTLEIAGIIVGV